MSADGSLRLAALAIWIASGAAQAQTFEPYYADTSSYEAPAFRIVDAYPQPNPGCLWITATSVDVTSRPIRITLELTPAQSCDISGGAGGLITNTTVGLGAPLAAGTSPVEFGYLQDGVYTQRKTATLVVDDGTGKCSRIPEANVLLVEASSGTAFERIAAVVSNPALDPQLFADLGRPLSVYRFLTLPWLNLTYAPLDDTQDLKRRIEANRSALGINFAETNGFVCFIPTYEPVEFVEFYNTDLKHYFMSADKAEIASIEAGGSGPGWQRTGESFKGINGDACHSYAPNPTPLFRFYGTRGVGPNSHFFTADRAECGAVRRDPGWTFESVPVRVYAPIAGACPASSTPVHRLYNGRAGQNDSNHRYAARLAVVDAMVASGWTYEGVTLCIPQLPNFTKAAR